MIHFITFSLKGCGIESWSDDGKAEESAIPGELVCTNPFPSMPVAFWNDKENKLYHAAYFEKFPGNFMLIFWNEGYFDICDKVILDARFQMWVMFVYS